MARLQESIRDKLLALSATPVDRLLRTPRNASRSKRPRRIEPAPKRRTRMRTFADWNEPLPGCMEMDLVAHCGTVNRGSYVHSLVFIDIASGWTECAPLVVRESNGIQHLLIQPAKPMQNGYIESFDGKARDACLNDHWFETLPQARSTIENARNLALGSQA